MTNPKRGEIWLVQLDPTRGQEIQKTRPASSIGVPIIIPVTRNYPWTT